MAYAVVRSSKAMSLLLVLNHCSLLLTLFVAVLCVFGHCLQNNSYSIACPLERVDNPQALASGLSYVKVDKHGITILYNLNQCRPCTSRDISR